MSGSVRPMNGGQTESSEEVQGSDMPEEASHEVDDASKSATVLGNATIVLRRFQLRVSGRGSVPHQTLETVSKQEKTNLFGQIASLKNKGAEANKDAENAARAEREKYHDGPVGKLVKHPYFERVTLMLILVNAIWIGFDVDYTARVGKEEKNLYKGDGGFIFMENLFCVYFTAEIILRFLAYARKSTCLCDGWFLFDSFLVTLMVIEVWILPVSSEDGEFPIPGFSVLRLLRLLRITRMAKVMRMFPELMMILKGISAASKAVFWAAVLLLVITFTASILFTNEFHQGTAADEDLTEPPAIVFGSMGKSMKNLLIMGTILDDVTYCADAIRASENIWMLLAFIVYILFNSFTMLNMLVGILVEVVGSTSEGEKERLAEEGAAQAIRKIFDQMDKDGSGLISREEFMSMRRDKHVMKSLSEMSIKEDDFDKYAKILFQRSDGESEPMISYEELVTLVRRLRPGVRVSALDVAEFKQRAVDNQERMKDRIKAIRHMLDLLHPDGKVVDTPKKSRTMSLVFELNGPRSAADVGPSCGYEPTAISRLGEVGSVELVDEIRRRFGLPDSPWAPGSLSGEPGAEASPALAMSTPCTNDGEAFQAQLEAAQRQLMEPEGEPEWAQETYSC